MSRASGYDSFHCPPPATVGVTAITRRYYLEKVRCLSAYRCAAAYLDRECGDAGDRFILDEPRWYRGDLCAAGRHCSALAAFALYGRQLKNGPGDREAMMLTQIAPTLWSNYGAATIAFLGFL